MTKQEAIDELKYLAECSYVDEFEPTEKEALKMAIKALEQELCEDAISRQAVIEQTYNWSKDEFLRVTNPFDYLRKRINSLPSVNPQKPKTGHWISHREHCENLGVLPSGLGAYKWCSECDCGIDVREWHRNNYNYCPNCGAKMKEGE